MDFERFKLEVEDGDTNIVFEQLAKDVLSIASDAEMPESFWMTDRRIQRASHVLNLTPRESYGPASMGDYDA